MSNPQTKPIPTKKGSKREIKRRWLNKHNEYKTTLTEDERVELEKGIFCFYLSSLPEAEFLYQELFNVQISIKYIWSKYLSQLFTIQNLFSFYFTIHFITLIFTQNTMKGMKKRKQCSSLLTLQELDLQTLPIKILL